MIPLAAFTLGAITGVLRARKRGGNAADIALYGAVHGIILALAALMAVVLFARLDGL